MTGSAGIMQRACVAVKSSQPAQPSVSDAEGENLSDAVLVARVAAGDGSAFGVLVERHVAAVSGVARRMLGDDAEAEDVTQEAFLKLWRLGGGLVVEASGVRPWLRRVVSNLAIDRIRMRRRTDVTDDVPEVPVAADQLRVLVGEETAMRVDQALQALPERQRLALTLFHFEGLSQREVAASMSISDEAVESLLARGRRGLKTALQDDWQELIADQGDDHDGAG